MKIIIPILMLCLFTAHAGMKFEPCSGYIDHEFSGTNPATNLITDQIASIEQNTALPAEQRTLQIKALNRLLSAVQEEWKSIVEEQNRIRLHYYNMRQGGLGFGLQSLELVALLRDTNKLLPSPRDCTLTQKEVFAQLREINQNILNTENTIKAEVIEGATTSAQAVANIRRLTTELDAVGRELCASGSSVVNGVMKYFGDDKPLREIEVRRDEIHPATDRLWHKDDKKLDLELSHKLGNLSREIKKEYASLILPELPKYQKRLEQLHEWHMKKAELQAVIWWRYIEELRFNNKNKQNKNTHSIADSVGSE